MEESTPTVDAVIFGASGFTVKQVLKWWLRLAAKESGTRARRWSPSIQWQDTILRSVFDGDTNSALNWQEHDCTEAFNRR